MPKLSFAQRSKIMKKVWAKRTKAEKRRLMSKIRKGWTGLKSKERRKRMPPKTFKGLTQAEIKMQLQQAGKRYVPIGGYIVKDVGRPKHHYIFAKKTRYGWEKVRPPRGIKTIKGLVPRKELIKHMTRIRQKWIKMSPEKRKKLMPERKGKAGYKKIIIPRIHPRTGTRFKTTIWVRK